MAYNSTAINEFQDIWVFCEQRDGKLMNTDFELISEGRKLANERGSKLVGILLGHNIQNLAKELGGYGADKVIICENPALEVYTTDAYTKVLCDLAMDKKPDVLLLGASNIGRDLGPRCAARLHTGLTADCTHLDINMDHYINFLKNSSTLDLDSMTFDMHDQNLKMTRPAFGGHLMATIICPRFRPCMSTIRPGVMKKAPFDQVKTDSCEIETYPCQIEDAVVKAKVLKVVKETKQMIDLVGADIIVSVGRGIGKNIQKGIALAQELADALGGGVVGGSRASIDAGWLSADHQIGQTGKTVHPKIYVALGISGAIQHKAGMQDSDLIIAINKNEAAPIFDIADYGITGDLFKFVPFMIESVKAARTSTAHA